MSGRFHGRLITAAFFRLLLGSAERSPHDVGLLPRLHGTATLSIVMVSVGFLRGCCDRVLLQPPENMLSMVMVSVGFL